jgi:hypothetical protein
MSLGSHCKTKSGRRLGTPQYFPFKQALATKSLWRVLTQDGIWHRVIYGKYITPLSLTSWLRHTVTCPTIASPIWRSLLKNLHFIQHWLCWKPGSGHSIHIGRDVILGLGSTAFLTPGLLNYLREKQVFYLFQAMDTTEHGVICTNGKIALTWVYHRRYGSGMAVLLLNTSWSGDTS